MRKVHPELTNLKGESLQFEILSRNKLLQEDLVIILLDELKKGREIKGVALIRSKDAAIDYLLKKIEENLSRIDISRSTPAMRVLLDRTKIEENFGALVREGFNRRFDELKVR